MNAGVRGRAKGRQVVRRLAVAALAVGLLFTAAAPANAAQPTKRYTSCKALWKKYPRGVVLSAYFAERAVKNGFQRPQVRGLVYLENQWLEDDFVVCAKPLPDVVPNAPAISSAWASPQGLTITALWGAPANAGKSVVYDVYLNGTKVNEGLTTTTYTWTGLTASTAYTVGVTARNPAGTSPMATSTVTTVTQEQADHPGKVKVVYSATGLVDVTMQSPSGTQQYGAVSNPTYEFWFSPGAFVYFSVQNQNDSGDVSCSVTSNGRTVARNSSSGAYVIASCSGKA